MTDTAEYTVSLARYAGRWSDKRQMAVSCPSTNGLKTRAARLAVALKGRWSNREEAYIMSATKAARFERLYAEGWDASYFGELEAPEAA